MIKKIIVFLMILSLGFTGCAKLGTFTPQGAEIANKIVDIATVVLKNLDVIYPALLADKLIPDFLGEATAGLQKADIAATILHNLIDGAVAPDQQEAQLNQAIDLVAGASTVSNQIQAQKFKKSIGELQ